MFDLQIIKHNYFTALAEDQHEIFKKLVPERGEIFCHSSANDPSVIYPFAINRDVYLVYAVPSLITNPEDTLKKLESILPLTNVSHEQLLARLSKKNDPYEPILRRVEEAQIEKLKQLNLIGIKWLKEKGRFYPENNLGSHVLGFVNQADNQETGAYGLEAYYNKELTGVPGFLRGEVGNLGNFIALGQQDVVPAENGADVILTIDKNIEFFSCKKLVAAVQNFEADSGSLIVMEPQTGKILAMCNAPDFNPNKYNEVEGVKVFTNSAISVAYEPGSIFKPITMSAAIEEKAVTLETTYQDPGQIKIADFTIYNYDKKSHGTRTMTQVLEESLNTGAVFASRKIGIEKFTEYVKKFNMGVKTKIDMFNEAAGNISSLNKKHELYMATASFGQGIMTTPLQMVSAYAAILNGGKLMRPYIVEELRYDNKPAEITKPQVVRQVVSPETAKKVAAMLVSVVNNGHAKNAKISGYLVGGKTGTAQIADQNSGKYSENVTHSFVEFAPFNNPKFVLIVKLENVKKVKYAESSALPTATKIAKFILDYYAVEPEIK
ncbi:penicillin-binding protein 2 [Candidatus Falkowbacteria bacterium]|nr:penicillin-binding protein 2 [Candidatus Falkowbacteria bacterium]